MTCLRPHSKCVTEPGLGAKGSETPSGACPAVDIVITTVSKGHTVCGLPLGPSWSLITSEEVPERGRVGLRVAWA